MAAPEKGIGERSREPLLAISELTVDLQSGNRTVHAVRGLSYDVRPGEMLGMAGESGSGKSMSALAIMGLLPPGGQRSVGGSVTFHGNDLLALSPAAMRRLRAREIAMVFQDPLSSLNPVRTVGSQIAEVLRRQLNMRNTAGRRRAIELMQLVGIPDAASRYRSYPHQFSGGMRQRVMIAMAIACEPKLLIADEPTTALDVSVQSQIIELFERLRRELGMAVLLISHDLGLIGQIADRVLIVYAGRVVESGTPDDIFARPSHPYTRGLLASIPRIDRPRRNELPQINGAPPDLAAEIRGCPFAPRCPLAEGRCAEDPPTTWRAPGHSAACWVTS